MNRRTNKSDAIINDIISLFNDFGKADYIGEPVSLIEHSLQAANEASKAVKKTIGFACTLNIMNEPCVKNEKAKSTHANVGL